MVYVCATSVFEGIWSETEEGAPSDDRVTEQPSTYSINPGMFSQLLAAAAVKVA